MKAVSKIMTGAVGIAALVGAAAPAAAQYGGYYPGYNTGGNVIGQVLGAILNPYGQQQQYGQVSTQTAVNRCATAVHGSLAQRYSAGYGSAYGSSYGYNPYGASGYAQSNARVLQVTGVEPRSSTTMPSPASGAPATCATSSP